jgi:predicted membrane-bound mannosyltransferase/DNA-binding beta-propeller fold protein YncE
MASVAEAQTATTPLERRLSTLLVLDAEKVAYLAIFVTAVLTRFWDLGARVMSHDESLHTKFSWDLYRGYGFQHTPLMHGPLLFHMTALNYFLFGDNDFTSRIYPALIGILVVMFPLLLRRWLGRLGALSASALFLISPLIVYYSRYIRHDLPAILFAMAVAWTAWRYIEERKNKWLVWLAIAQALMFASKEVAFIYIAIFGSFLTIYFVVQLLGAEWPRPGLRRMFGGLMIGILIALVALGVIMTLHGRAAELLSATETAPPADPNAIPVEAGGQAEKTPLDWLLVGTAGVLGGLVVGAVIVVMVGMWPRLRDYPTLDVMLVMGTLILPLLSPFAVLAAGFNPVDESEAGVQISAAFAGTFLALSVLIGVLWGMRPPRPRTETGSRGAAADETAEEQEAPEMSRPGLEDWGYALLTSRWWAIGGLYWLIYIFFFTTMFTNGNGLGTGVVGSLGYWLAQQDVERGSQPIYYYVLVMIPIYEFLPLLLTLAAGPVGLAIGLTRVLRGGPQAGDKPEGNVGLQADATSEPPDIATDSGPTTRFPALLFIGYWVVLNFVAYSLAGEKMPWLTTHLTTPMILLGGWVIGRLLESIEWSRLWTHLRSEAALVLILLPVAAIALGGVLSPILKGDPLLRAETQTDLAATGAWIAALLVFVGACLALVLAALRLGPGQTTRLAALLAVGGLAFLTARAAWLAAFVNYDYATEFLVYAHSAPSVKLVMERIEEISQRTTDGDGLVVAYDNRVSWPFSWYLRNYPNAVFYGTEPTRGALSDAPVILAGPDNWVKVEPLLGNRYHKFEYIRMWWPMQDYFNLTWPRIGEMLSDPAIRRGLWQIFIRREYTAYGQATGQDFSLSNWPVAERMRLYVRKDVFAQVWDYGASAADLAEAIDPYAQYHRALTPVRTFGSLGAEPGQLDGPRDIAIGPDGLLYVADSRNHRISVFDPDGELVRTFGGRGDYPAPGVFNEPWGLDLSDDGLVYVADTWNHRIQVFTSEGEFVRQWGYFGQTGDPNALWGPRDVAVGDDGTVYVADTGNKRIRVYTSDGHFLRDIGGPGGLDGQLDEPVGLALGPDGNLYVADTWNQRVQVFGPDGGFVQQWPVEAWYGQSLDNKPYLALDSTGNVYLTDPEGFRILVFALEGRHLYNFGDYTTINLASGVGVDAEGNLYVTDGAAGVVQVYIPGPVQ